MFNLLLRLEGADSTQKGFSEAVCCSELYCTVFVHPLADALFAPAIVLQF